MARRTWLLKPVIKKELSDGKKKENADAAGIHVWRNALIKDNKIYTGAEGKGKRASLGDPIK